MDLQTGITLIFGGVLAAVGVFNAHQGYQTQRKSRETAEALKKVATAEQLDGKLTLFRQVVREEAETRIRAAEKLARDAFMRGMEAARDPLGPASADAVAKLQTAVEAAREGAQAVRDGR
jgi:predicted negative regulator of RcsB-dependent stress response